MATATLTVEVPEEIEQLAQEYVGAILAEAICSAIYRRADAGFNEASAAVIEKRDAFNKAVKELGK